MSWGCTARRFAGAGSRPAPPTVAVGARRRCGLEGGALIAHLGALYHLDPRGDAASPSAACDPRRGSQCRTANRPALPGGRRTWRPARPDAMVARMSVDEALEELQVEHHDQRRDPHAEPPRAPQRAEPPAARAPRRRGPRGRPVARGARGPPPRRGPRLLRWLRPAGRARPHRCHLRLRRRRRARRLPEHPCHEPPAPAAARVQHPDRRHGARPLRRRWARAAAARRPGPVRPLGTHRLPPGPLAGQPAIEPPAAPRRFAVDEAAPVHR